MEFKIVDLTCDACVKLSSGVLQKIPGVLSVNIDVNSGLTKVEASREISLVEINDALSKVDKKAVALN